MRLIKSNMGRATNESTADTIRNDTTALKYQISMIAKAEKINQIIYFNRSRIHL
jgi:hypothetical protein